MKTLFQPPTIIKPRGRHERTGFVELGTVWGLAIYTMMNLWLSAGDEGVDA
jgi:hypothetical protein